MNHGPLPPLRTYEQGRAARRASSAQPVACGQSSEWWRGWYDELAHQVNRDTAHGEIDRAIRFYEGSPTGQYDNLAVDGLRALQEKARLIELLANAVKRIDEGYSGPADILDDPLMAEARALAQAAQQSDPPAPGNTSR